MKSESEIKSLKLRNMPMGKLIFSMSLPAIFSMLIQALYNIIDTMYVSNYDKSGNGVVALGYAFIIQTIVLALALGIGIGANILISRRLGEDRIDDASNIARTSLLMSFGVGVVILFCGFFIPNWFMKLSSGVEVVQDYGIEYLEIIMFLSIFMIIEINISKMLQSMGRMIVPMLSQLVGAIVNIILDPIFIFNLGLGIKGAAIATVLGQFAAFMIVLVYVLTHKLDITLNYKNYKFKFVDMEKTFFSGIPTIVMNSLSAIINIVLYALLRKLDPSEQSIGVLSLFFKLQSFVFMPIFGLTQGGLPILSYNFGANLQKRFKKGLMILYVTAMSVMVVGFMLFQFAPNFILSMFTLEVEIMDMGRNALKIMSFLFLTAGLSVISITAFQSIGYGTNALLMSVLRQAGLLIPFAFILSSFMGVNGVWLAYPLSESLCTIIFLPILFICYKKAFEKKNKELYVE